jgi:hypothetical protein
MTPEDYFNSDQLVSKKLYDALCDFFANKLSAGEVAKKFGGCAVHLIFSTKQP